MKTYEKPMLLANEELAEGVYAASGSVGGADGADCYRVTTNMHQKPETGRGDYRIQVNAQHLTNHHGSEQVLVLYFNKPVTYSSSNGTLVSGNNTATIRIKYNYHQNGGDNIGLGDVVVVAEAGLAITGAEVICNKYCPQH